MKVPSEEWQLHFLLLPSVELENWASKTETWSRQNDRETLEMPPQADKLLKESSRYCKYCFHFVQIMSLFNFGRLLRPLIKSHCPELVSYLFRIHLVTLGSLIFGRRDRSPAAIWCISMNWFFHKNGLLDRGQRFVSVSHWCRQRILFIDYPFNTNQYSAPRPLCDLNFGEIIFIMDS